MNIGEYWKEREKKEIEYYIKYTVSLLKSGCSLRW